MIQQQEYNFHQRSTLKKKNFDDDENVSALSSSASSTTSSEESFPSMFFYDDERDKKIEDYEKYMSSLEGIQITFRDGDCNVSTFDGEPVRETNTEEHAEDIPETLERQVDKSFQRIKTALDSSFHSKSSHSRRRTSSRGRRSRSAEGLLHMRKELRRSGETAPHHVTRTRGKCHRRHSAEGLLQIMAASSCSLNASNHSKRRKSLDNKSIHSSGRRHHGRHTQHCVTTTNSMEASSNHSSKKDHNRTKPRSHRVHRKSDPSLGNVSTHSSSSKKRRDHHRCVHASPRYSGRAGTIQDQGQQRYHSHQHQKRTLSLNNPDVSQTSSTTHGDDRSKNTRVESSSAANKSDASEFSGNRGTTSLSSEVGEGIERLKRALPRIGKIASLSVEKLLSRKTDTVSLLKAEDD